MKSIKTIPVFFLFLFIGEPIIGQRLLKGNKLPGIEINDVLNYKDGNMKFEDFLGKLVVLDFWNPGCKACIEGFGKLEELQKEMGEKVQVILVSTISTDSTKKFFGKLKKINMPQLPMVSNDTLLKKLFQHQIQPHHVWINEEGKVLYETNGWNTNVATVRKYFINNSLPGSDKEDVTDFDIQKPYIAEGNGRWLDRIHYYSYLMNDVTGLPNRDFIKKRVDGLPYHISVSSASIKELFKKAFSEGGAYNFNAGNCIELIVRDKENWVRPKETERLDEWLEEYCFNYELKIPPGIKNMYSIFQEDLKRLYNVDAAIKIKKINVLLLTRTTKVDLLKTKGRKRETNLWVDTDNERMYLYNMPFDVFLSKLNFVWNHADANMSFKDVSCYKGNIDIELPAHLFTIKDVQAWNKELNKYGLAIIEASLPQNVLTIQDKRVIK